jgi:hypothetical protein
MGSRQFKYENKPTPENQVSSARFLLDLATEVLIQILAYLPPADMIAMQCTCHMIRGIVTGTAYLQYTLHARINGVDDLLPPGVPYSERLELLRRHEQSWSGLQFDLFVKPHRISEWPNRPFYTFQDGHLIYECRLGQGGDLRYGYTDLCSADRNEELRWVHLTIASIGESRHLVSTVVFAVDHDLVIAMRFCVHFDSFSEYKADNRVTAVSMTEIVPPWLSWNSLNSRRANLIHVQHHTLCH